MEKKLKIGLFIDTYYPMIDGVVSVVDNYAKRLANKGEVTVFAPSIPGEEFDDSVFNYKVVRCKSKKLPALNYSLALPELDKEFRKTLKKSDLDIVHIHSPFSIGKTGIEYAKKNNIPVVATMHSQFKQDFKRATKSESLSKILTKRLIKQFNKCDECWAVNHKVAEVYYHDYKYKKMPKVFNNATEMMPIQDVEEANKKINDLHGLNTEDKVFLFVGRINKLKNIFFIVDSLKILKEKADFPFKMLFVGSGQDEKDLAEHIESYGMQEDIILCGRVTDRDLLASYFARADLFLFPSLYDASSIVQIEAASQKTPTVFIEGSVTSATVTNDETGFIAKNDVTEYANKILEIMENDQLYKTVSEKVLKEIYKNWDDSIDEVFEKYKKLIKHKKK